MPEYPTGFFTSRRLAVYLLAATILIILTGCQSTAYYSQAISGQIDLLLKRRAIAELMNHPDTSEKMKKKLQLVLDLRRFARDELHLPVGGNFESYADLKRPYAVWTLYATPEFSFKPLEWCYPIIGCLTYRGYFRKDMAASYARELKNKGFDVYVGGAVAYSTLGWFDDPVLNTFVNRQPTRLAYLIFHELAHKQIYLKDDTPFNEGLATALGWEGVRRWLAVNSPEDMADFKALVRRREQFVALVDKYQILLKKLYRTQLPAVFKRQKKAWLLDRMKDEYQVLKADWNGYEGYDSWFAKPLNNAQLLSVATYNDYVTAFQRILAEQGGDLKLFYRRCQELGEWPKARRRRILLEEKD